MDEHDNNYTDLDKIVWGLFTKTGNVAYYSLYSKVKVKKDRENEERK